MSLTALPVELLDAICEPLECNLSALASFALTCAAAYPSATRVLYRTVSVSAFAGNLPVVRTLATRPDLARLVHAFSITLSDADAVLRAFYVQLQTALRRMSQLESLELLVDSNASWVLSGLANPHRIGHFVCSFPLDTHVAAFLARTPALRSLQISDPAPSSTQVLSEDHVPQLQSYTGPASLLPLLASRPLSTIHLSGDLRIEDIPQSAGAPIFFEPGSESNSHSYPAPKNSGSGEGAKGYEQVQILSAITSAPPASVLEALAVTYPSLSCLKLMTTSAFWESPDMTLYTRIAATLASLSSLTVFELSGVHWEARTKSPSSCSPKTGEEEKEWVSPPVTPRATEFHTEIEALLENQSQDLGFGEAFFDWSY